MRRRYGIEVAIEPDDVTEPFTPVSVRIDFAARLRELGSDGVFAPRSVVVTHPEDGREQTVPHSMSEEFARSDAGEVSWAVRDRSKLVYHVTSTPLSGDPTRPPAPSGW